MNDDTFDFPDVPKLTDPVVTIHMVNGNSFQIEDVSIIEVAQRLHTNGFVFFADGGGEYAVFLKHGVAALTATGKRDSN